MRRVFALVSILWLASATFASAADGQVVTAARLGAIADHAAHALVTDPDRETQATYRFTDQTVPNGKVSIELGSTQYNPSYVAIPLLIYVDGKLARTVFAGYRIISFIRTAVAAHDLPSGAVLGDGDVAIARIEANGRTTVDPGALVGRKLNVSVARGTPLFVEQTRVNELVIAGQPVIYILHDGPVMVSADVIARTGGGLGQLVAVYNPATNKALSGIVTGPGKVEFTLPGSEVTQ